MSARDIAPFVRFVMRCHIGAADTKTANRAFKTRDCRLFYILSGRGSMEIGSELYTLRPGVAVLFQSGTEYMWCPDTRSDGVDYLSVNFDYTLNFRHLRDCWFPSAARDFSEDDALEHLIFYDAPALNSPVYLARASALEEPLGAMLGASLSGAPFSEERLSAMMKLAVYQALDLTRWAEICARHLGPLGVAVGSEPGDFLTKEASVHLAEVVSVERRDGVRFVGLDTGWNVMGEHFVYGALLEVVLCRAVDAPALDAVTIAGHINEGNDLFAEDLPLPEVAEGDILAALGVGSYNASMTSEHCLRPAARSVSFADRLA
jgi:hypothetical protein